MMLVLRGERTKHERKEREMKITTGTDRKTKAMLISVSGTTEEKHSFEKLLSVQAFVYSKKDQAHFIVPNNSKACAFVARFE